MLNPSRMIQKKKKKIKLPATAQVPGKTKNSNSRTELRKQKTKNCLLAQLQPSIQTEMTGKPPEKKFKNKINTGSLLAAWMKL